MSRQDDALFENVPRKPLAIPIARSRLLHALADELTADSEKDAGKRVVELSNLGTCTDDELKPLVPIILPGCKISIRDGFAHGGSPMTGRTYRLFSIPSAALTVFNMINGTNNIEQISQRLAQETGWTEDRSLAYTRGVFLALVGAGLCIPRE